MNKEIFRQKSIERIQSPDNLKEYIKVINPSIWVVFISVFLLLAGAFLWGTYGKIEDKMPITATVSNGQTSCSYYENVQEEMQVSVNGVSGRVYSVSKSSISIVLDEEIPDGAYSGYVVLNEISPISFVFN